MIQHAKFSRLKWFRERSSFYRIFSNIQISDKFCQYANMIYDQGDANETKKEYVGCNKACLHGWNDVS